MDKLMITPSKAAKFGVNIAKDGVSRSANQILGQKSVNMSKIREIWPEINHISCEIDEQLEINSHYKGYLKKQNADRIIVPGKFRGNLKRLSNFFKIPVERGPDDISDLPDYFGVEKPDNQLEKYDCEIFAEIVDAAILTPTEIQKIAKSYKKDGL